MAAHVQPVQHNFDYDYIVVGSGFGGSVAALRLTEKGYRVAVMEMGRRWTPENLPDSTWSLHRWFWRPSLGLKGFFSMRFFRHITVLHGCAVGGGSITYACTSLRPPDKVWRTGSWAGLADWESEMPPHYDTVSRMLGITRNTILGPADLLLKQVAEEAGVGATFYQTSVAILQSPPGTPGGQAAGDPYFNGEGPPRSTCTGCGGCMMGCRHGAKNSLDMNYLWLAEKRGAKIFAETKVVDVKPLDGCPDGASGYQVRTRCSTALLARKPQQFTCRGVVFSASSLGTMDLLFDLKDRGSLPGISDALGKHVRTNSESLLAVRTPGIAQDLSQGVAIGSGIYIDEHTHIEAVRYPHRSDTMSLLTTPLTGGTPGIQRVILWLKNLITIFLRHPIRTLRLIQPFGWARENVVLLCMQALEGDLQMRWTRPWYWPFRKCLTSHGEKVPTYIPQANAFAERFARLTGGTAMSMTPEILFNVPGTAHCLGGAVIGASPDHGVVDNRHRVFGYQNMYVCDGSVVGANLGVNPSLTITALAERAMSFIPPSHKQRSGDYCSNSTAPRLRTDSAQPTRSELSRVSAIPTQEPAALPKTERGEETVPSMHFPGYLARHTAVSAAFVLAYLALNQPDVILLARIGFVAWYPATGLVIAMMLGLSPWYAIVVAASTGLASSLIYHQPLLSFTNTVGVAGNVLCYGGAAYLLRNALRIDLGLRQRRDVVHYVWMSTVAAAGNTVFGVSCLLADHSIQWHDRMPSAIGWFLGDMIGLIGVAPFLLVHIMPHVRQWVSPVPAARVVRKTTSSGGFLLEICGQVLATLFVLWVMFGTADGRYDHFYLGFIPVLWTAMRQGVRRAVTALLALNFGIIVAMQLFPPTTAQYNKVALFMLVQSAAGLIVGSEVSERHRLAIHLSEKTSYLDGLIQNSPLGIVVLDQKARIDFANPAFEKLLQYGWHELPSIDHGIVEAERGSTRQSIAQILAGETSYRTVRQSRKDGTILDLAVHGVPLLLNGRVMGAYLIYEDVSEQARAAEAQRQHAQSLNDLVRQLESRTRQMTHLSEMGLLLECSATVKEACAIVADSVQKLFPGTAGSLYLFKSSRNLIEAAAHWGDPGISELAFQPDACWSLRRGQPHWTGRAASGIHCAHLPEHPGTLSLCVPMIAQGNTLGTLHLEFDASDSTAEKEREGCEQLAVSAASQIALSLANLQLRETLREQSIRDPLTRLFNRRFLEESLERELQLATRKHQPLTVLFVDLDHFKTFNDAFGHDAGDTVLQHLAQLFCSFFRATDICCRYGGEEFAIILPESSAWDALIRAESLRDEVKKLRLQHMKQPLGPISISVGIATFPDHATSSSQLLAAADRCLYESKTRGRDRVTVAGQQPA